MKGKIYTEEESIIFKEGISAGRAMERVEIIEKVEEYKKGFSPQTQGFYAIGQIDMCDIILALLEKEISEATHA